MVLVWVLAFLLYGPAILSWEYLSGGSSIPEGHCYAEFFYNWYFLITASTLEFFTPLTAWRGWRWLYNAIFWYSVSLSAYSKPLK